MIYHCVVGSLSKVGRTKVMVREHQYKIKGRPSGNILLKIIIREIHLDRNATPTSIRNQLSSLDHFITTVGCNITKFNEHVQLLLEGLALRRETTHDLLSNLFKNFLCRLPITRLQNTSNVNRNNIKTVRSLNLPPL